MSDLPEDARIHMYNLPTQTLIEMCKEFLKDVPRRGRMSEQVYRALLIRKFSATKCHMRSDQKKTLTTRSSRMKSGMTAENVATLATGSLGIE